MIVYLNKACLYTKEMFMTTIKLMDIIETCKLTDKEKIKLAHSLLCDVALDNNDNQADEIANDVSELFYKYNK